MIRAELMLTEQQCELRVQGHADFDRFGRDIVCAAVSALVSALADHVEEEAGCGTKVSAEIRSGHAVVRAGGNRCEAFRLVYRGLCRLSRTYPEHVAVAVSGSSTGVDVLNKEEGTT